MPVSSFECQIARGQIGRYLGGGVLSPEAMKGLEEHLAECPSCKALVAERRAELMGKLHGDVPTHAVVSVPVSKAAATPAASKENPLIAALRARDREIPPADERPASAPRYAGSNPRYAKPKEKEPIEPPKPAVKERPQDRTAPRLKPTAEKARTPAAATSTAKPTFTKPMVLMALLAVVLLGMNYAMRGNGGKGVLGGKASDAFASQRFAEPGASTPSNPGVASGGATSPDAPKTTAEALKNEVPAMTGAKNDVKPGSSPETTATSSTEPKTSETPKTVEPSPNSTPPNTTPKSTPENPSKEKPASEKPAAQNPISKTTPPVQPAASVKTPTSKTPAKAPVKAPVKTAAKPAAKTTVQRTPVRRRNVVKPRRAPQKSAPAIRVYGPDGKPLNP